VLRQAQKAGDKEAHDKDKLGHFVVHDRSEAKRLLLTAPFLGKLAFERELVGEAFVDDYLEFHRCYRAAFVHWLQTLGMKTKPASNERFGVLLRRLMRRQGGDDLDSLSKELYQVPLASKDPEVDTLERRFLAWIAEAR